MYRSKSLTSENKPQREGTRSQPARHRAYRSARTRVHRAARTRAHRGQITVGSQFQKASPSLAVVSGNMKENQLNHGQWSAHLVGRPSSDTRIESGKWEMRRRREQSQFSPSKMEPRDHVPGKLADRIRAGLVVAISGKRLIWNSWLWDQG